MRIGPVTAGVEYTCRARFVNAFGVASPWAADIVHVATPDTTPPDPPTAVSVTALVDALQVQWTNPADLDLAAIEIWQSTTNDSTTAAKVAESSGINVTIPGLVTGTPYYHWLKARDRSGNTSGFDATQYAGHAGTPT